ncbi:hypothetical protein BLOT_000646 [Blomia tropicalis]|nr:hypothetical protein BLOT_000646 [Blomia tropicalis]
MNVPITNIRIRHKNSNQQTINYGIKYDFNYKTNNGGLVSEFENKKKCQELGVVFSICKEVEFK